MKSDEPEETKRSGLDQKTAPPRVLFTTVYRNESEPYDYIGSNSRSKWFRFRWPRNQSFGLRFLKQNIPELEIVEFPTFDEYQNMLEEGWDVVGLSFYLSETEEALEMVKAARASGKVGEVWAGNYGALTPEIGDKFDRVFVGYAENQVAPYFNRKIERIVHPPLVEYLDTPFGLKLNIYGALFTIRGCGVGCKFCQAPCFCNKPSPLPLESIENVLSYYKDHKIKRGGDRRRKLRLQPEARRQGRRPPRRVRDGLGLHGKSRLPPGQDRRVGKDEADASKAQRQ